MPCHDGGHPHDYDLSAGVKAELSRIEAMLCAVLRVVDKQQTFGALITAVNQDDMGFPSRDIVDWYREHKAKDEKRLERVRQTALRKLTNEERKALGV